MRVRFLLIASTALVLACGPGQAGSGGEDEDPVADVPPDLPCGGADLLTDDQNCGECGNACGIEYQGTEWEVGNCVEGQCGPRWKNCEPYDEGETCAEICAKHDQTCSAGGCAGYAGVLLDASWFGSDCILTVLDPVGFLSTCEDPLVLYEDDLVQRQVMCCCS